MIKTTAGAIADCSRSHRAVFLGGIVVMLASLSGLYWTPHIPSPCFNNTLIGSLNASKSSLNPQGSLTSRHSWPNASEMLSGDPDEGEAVTNVSTGPQGAKICPSSSHTHTVYLSGGELVSHYQFWVLFLYLLLQYCGHVVVITLQETVCFQMLGSAHHEYGQQRLWGTVGWGLSAIVSGALVDWYSKGLLQKDYWPAHVLTVVFLMADLVVVARLKFSIPDKRMTPSAVHRALWQPHVVLILITLVVIGTTCGVLWTFQFLLVEDVALQWDPDFPHLKLLLGLVLGVQCFLAEVPFFFLAGRIIKRIGHANAFLISLVGFAVRLNLYSVISNPWWFLPADILHGISFGISYPCLTSYASVISPPGAAATTQAIFGAAFFGGTGLGGLVGGRLFQELGGRKAFLTVGVFSGVYALVFIATHILLKRLCPANATRDVDSESAYEEGIREKSVEEEEVTSKEGEDKEEADKVEIEEVGLVERKSHVSPSESS
ncbi:major facilitator superfamily domain-containing protein 6-A-like isoform X2 [Cherax quadricarinatus]